MSENENETEERRRRGRPRPQDTIKRDEAVADVLADGEPRTRRQLAETLGWSPNVVYASLSRLRWDRRVIKVAGKNLYQAVVAQSGTETAES